MDFCTLNELKRMSPSLTVDKIDWDGECQRKSLLAKYITRLGMFLDRGQLAIYTAGVYMQRFYRLHPLRSARGKAYPLCALSALSLSLRARVRARE